MSKFRLEKRLNALEERAVTNPVRVVDMSDRQLCEIIGLGKTPTDAQLEELARGAHVLIIDDISGGDV